MTFVRAQRVGDQIAIQSDWLVTDESRLGPPGYSDGILKTLVLGPTTCVSLAGNVHDGLVAICKARDVLASGAHDVRAEIIAILCEASKTRIAGAMRAHSRQKRYFCISFCGLDRKP